MDLTKNKNLLMTIPLQGMFCSDDAASRKRKELAEKLKRGESIRVAPTGTPIDPNSPEAQQHQGKNLLIPDGKLALTKYESDCYIPLRGLFRSDDAASRKRKELAEKLKRGESIRVAPTGTPIDPNSPEAQQQQGKNLFIPDGKLASDFYWYNRDPVLLNAEKRAMQEHFPQFQLDKLEDGRLCWVGTIKPCGEKDIHWTLMAVYDHDHPNNNSFGGSVKIYSISPDLNELQQQVGGRGLPHVLRDSANSLYMCTARKEDVDSGERIVTSALASLLWAVKWTFAVTCWLNGDVGDEIYDHTF